MFQRLLVLAIAFSNASLLAEDKSPDIPHSVVISGTLATDVTAAGGEATGTVLRVGKRTYELHLGDSSDLKATAARLQDKLVRATGNLQVNFDSEMKVHWGIRVQTLQAVSEKPDESTELVLHALKFKSPETQLRILPIDSPESAVILVLTSETGIDSGVIRRTGDKWPERMILRLYLKGLECLEVRTDFTMMRCFVENQAPFQLHAATVNASGEEHILKTGDDLFPKFEMTRGPTFHAYEFVLPEKLFEGNPESFSIRLIDFYR